MSTDLDQLHDEVDLVGRLELVHEAADVGVRAQLKDRDLVLHHLLLPCTRRREPEHCSGRGGPCVCGSRAWTKMGPCT